MTQYYLRIVTDFCTQAVENALNQFLNSLPAISELHMEDLKPYWKNPEQGELLCRFSSSCPVEEIQAILADHWECGVADIRWSRILVPDCVFLWLGS